MKKKESVDVKKYTRQGTHGSTLLDLVRSKNPITLSCSVTRCKPAAYRGKKKAREDVVARWLARKPITFSESVRL
jgi:hypothetical protein